MFFLHEKHKFTNADLFHVEVNNQWKMTWVTNDTDRSLGLVLFTYENASLALGCVKIHDCWDFYS